MQQNTSDPPAFTSYHKLIIFILAVLQFTIVLDFMIISPLSDILLKSLNISTRQFGFIVSSYAISACIAGIAAAGFADKYDRKKLLLFFYIGFIVGTFFCGISNTYWTLLISRIVTGLFGGVIGSIILAIVTDLFLPNQRGRVMGTIQMAFGVSQIAGIPAGMLLAAKYSWHIAFIMIVILSLLLLPLILLKMKPVRAHLQTKTNKNPFEHLAHTASNPQYRKGFLAIALLAVGGFMIMPFSSAFLVNNVGITQEQLSLVFMFSGISSMVFMMFIGRLSDKFDRFTIFTLGSLLALIMVIIYTNLPAVPLWVVIVVNMILFMGVMGRIAPAMAINSMVPEAQDRGAYMSLTASLQQLSGGIGAIISGWIVVQPTKNSPIQHYDILGYIAAAVFVFCIFTIKRVDLMVKERKK